MSFKGLASERAKLVPLFSRFMTPAGAIWYRDQRNVIIGNYINASGGNKEAPKG